MNPYDFSDAQMTNHIGVCLRVIKRRLEAHGYGPVVITHEIVPMERDGTFESIRASWVQRQDRVDGDGVDMEAQTVQCTINYAACNEFIEGRDFDIESIYEHVWSRLASRMNMRGAGINSPGILRAIRSGVNRLLEVVEDG